MAKTTKQKQAEALNEKQDEINELKAKLKQAENVARVMQNDVSLMKTQLAEVKTKAEEEGVDVEIAREKPDDLVKVKVLRGTETFFNWKGEVKTYMKGEIIPDYEERLFVLAPAKKLELVE